MEFESSSQHLFFHTRCSHLKTFRTTRNSTCPLTVLALTFCARQASMSLYSGVKGESKHTSESLHPQPDQPLYPHCVAPELSIFKTWAAAGMPPSPSKQNLITLATRGYANPNDDCCEDTLMSKKRCGCFRLNRGRGMFRGMFRSAGLLTKRTLWGMYLGVYRGMYQGMFPGMYRRG